MKKTCFIILVCSLFLLSGKAQQDTMRVYKGSEIISYTTEQIDSIKPFMPDSIGMYKNNAITAKFNIYDIDSITFQQGNISPCPGTPTVTDIDGNVYKTVQIGSQCWLRENLKVTKYSDGTPITGRNSGASTAEDAPIYYYDMVHTTGESDSKYGLLYNWAAAVNVSNCGSDNNFYGTNRQGVCPMGWHVPSYAEWTTLISTLGGFAVAGGAMKTTDFYWSPPNSGATNSSGFSASPAGSYFNGFTGVTHDANFWSSTQKDAQNAHVETLGFNLEGVVRWEDYKYSGSSVRCVKD